MTTLESVLKEFREKFRDTHLTGIYPFNKSHVDELEAFLTSSLKTLASELVVAIPKQDYKFPGALPFPHHDDDVDWGWNKARNALLSEIKKRGLE